MHQLGEDGGRSSSKSVDRVTEPTKDGARTFTERLRDPMEVRAAVEDVTKRMTDLDRLVRTAVEDTLSYFHHRKKRFVRLTGELANATPSANILSNANAVIALDAAEPTRDHWNDHRSDVLAYLASPDTDRSTLGLSRDDPYTNSLIAVALKDRVLADTIPWPSQNEWPTKVLTNIERNRGGVAVESIGASAAPHAVALYWAVRALLVHHRAIRAKNYAAQNGGTLDELLLRAFEYAAATLYRLHTEFEGSSEGAADARDWVSYAFSVATLWHAPKWLERSHEMGDIRVQQRVMAGAIRLLMRNQRKRGLWRSGVPMWRTDPRTQIYPMSADALYALFEPIPELIARNELDPNAVLDRDVLDGIGRFIAWAESERQPAIAAPGQVDEAVMSRGWSTSPRADPQEPECWVTATVLRAAKAVRQAIEAASDSAARNCFDPPPGAALQRRNLALTERVKRALIQFDEAKDRHASWSAILAGPPGTGKTSLARCLDLERFLYISAATLLGDGIDRIPQRLEQTFEILRLLSGGVVLFDEIDEIVLERDQVADESSSRIFTTAMLPRFQGLKDSDRVHFLVATNHIEKFDVAIRREGRFDQVVAVEYPDEVAREKVLLQEIWQATCRRHETLARGALLRSERDLTRRLLGPVTKPSASVRGLELHKTLTKHADTESSVCDAISDFQGDTLDYRDRIRQLQERVALVKNFIASKATSKDQSDNPQLVSPAIDVEERLAGIGTIVDQIIDIIRATWFAAEAAMVAAKGRSHAVRFSEVRTLLDKWVRVAGGNRETWKEGFDATEIARHCCDVLDDMEAVRNSPECHGTNQQEMLRRLKYCANKLEREPMKTLVPAICDAVSALADTAAVQQTPVASPPELTRKAMRDLCNQLREWFEEYPRSDARVRQIVADLKDILPMLPSCSQTATEMRRAELEAEIVKQLNALVRNQVPALESAVRGARETMDNLAGTLASARGISVDPGLFAGKGVSEVSLEMGRTTDAWCAVFMNLKWLVGNRSSRNGNVGGFLLVCDRFDELFVKNKDRPGAGDEGITSLVEDFARMKPEDLVEFIQDFAPHLRLEHPVEPKQLVDWVWKYSTVHAILNRAIQDVLKSEWRESDAVPARKIPWGLPRSEQALRVGEHLSRTELANAAKEIAEKTELHREESLRRIQDEGDDPSSATRREIQATVRTALARAAGGARFYRDAEDYAWRVQQLPAADRTDGALHPRLRMPNLSLAARALLREFPVLYALRVDGENDPDLYPSECGTRPD